MTKKHDILIGASLLCSLFIYLFYRTEKTLVNEIVIWLISAPAYTSLKATIVGVLPLNSAVIYSLPEGLWIFCITLTSKPYYITINKRCLNCVYVPMLFCVLLEMLQLIHITNGRFDFVDIGVSTFFWLFARYGISGKFEKKHLLTRVNLRTMLCFTSYGIVYLAHVFK